MRGRMLRSFRATICRCTEDTGISIYAQGYTLIGFVIENFDTAIFQSVISGSNTIDISNTSIRDNVDGIRVEKDQGSPSTQIHYTLFQGNTGLDLINNAGSNNQYIYAQMNYWGCDWDPWCCITGSRTLPDSWISGDYYVDWKTKEEIADIYAGSGITGGVRSAVRQ